MTGPALVAKPSRAFLILFTAVEVFFVVSVVVLVGAFLGAYSAGLALVGAIAAAIHIELKMFGR